VHYHETNKHWNDFIRTVVLLQKNNRKNPTIVAILATESFFRPTLHRFFEYLYWSVLRLAGSEKEKYVSVGISQVQVRHWIKSGLISFSANQISTITKFQNPILNYDACKYFLSKNKLNGSSGKEIMKIYTGKTTRYHIEIYNHFYDNISAWYK